MKSTFLVTIAALFITCTNSGAQGIDGSTSVRAEERSISTFHAVDVTDGITLYLGDGKVGMLRVEASSQDLRSKVKTVVVGDVLKVYFDASADQAWRGLVGSTEKFKVYVTVAELHALQAAKGASIILENTLPISTELAVNLLSGAEITGELQVAKLAVKLRGGATADIKGSAADVTVRAIEGSSFKSPRLASEQCKVFASSGSNVLVSVHKSLEAEAINEAVIAYEGGAILKNELHSQGGKILHR